MGLTSGARGCLRDNPRSSVFRKMTVLVMIEDTKDRDVAPHGSWNVVINEVHAARGGVLATSQRETRLLWFCEREQVRAYPFTRCHMSNGLIGSSSIVNRSLCIEAILA